MGVLDSSYIKALGVKSPGLKQRFFIFHDTLLWSCCWKIDGAGIFFTESKVCFRIQIWSYDSLSETITLPLLCLTQALALMKWTTSKIWYIKILQFLCSDDFLQVFNAVSWFWLSRSLLYNIWNATAQPLDISTHNEK